METARMDPRWRMERPWARKRSTVQKVTKNSAMSDASESAPAQEESITLLQEQLPGHESAILENTTELENVTPAEDATPPYTEIEQSRPASSSASSVRSSLSGKTIYEPQFENYDHATANAKDIERLRNFIQYVLTIDYDVETATSDLPPADRQYFLQLGRQLLNLSGESTREQQRLKLACEKLKLPAHTVMSMIKRFRGHAESSQGVFDQDLLEYGKGEGDAVLATRLCLDKYVLVPKVVTRKKDRKALWRGNKGVWEASF
ncbi:hypothetical protein HII31_02629 [Pseudocercospora fuligena]|uniref:Uncharacterized protein n=1 Tax=Pseudocercospora fuligena TaxID=685502 RepID=A0A8H6VKP3_9PEZI|nr:hypothetical protein HII31_02629 [Pseudocercospora fuligena]